MNRIAAAAIALFTIAILSVQSFALLATNAPEGAVEADVVSAGPSVRITEVYPNAPGNDLGDGEAVPEFIKLHNQGEQPVSLSHLKLVRQDSAETMWFTDDPEATLPAGEYLYFQPEFGLVNSGMTLQLYFVDTSGEVEIQLQQITYPADAAETDSLSLQLYGGQWYTYTPSSPDEILAGFSQRAFADGEDTDDQDEASDNETENNEDNETEPPPEPNEPPQCGVTNKAVRISEILSNPPGYDSDGGEFVELYNASGKKVSLAGCTLATDKLEEYVFTTKDNIAPKDYKRVALSDKLLNGGGTATFSGKSYEFTISYPELEENTAYANIKGAWRITAKPTPGQPNRLPTAAERIAALNERLGMCPAGESRSLATHRCSSNQTESSKLEPCAPNQFRNPATNRCKLKSSADDELQPCDPNQFRNPETNRCKLKDSGDKLKPCGEDEYRSQETNRCRNKETIEGGVLGADSGKNSGGAKSNSRQNLIIVLIAGAFLLLFFLYEYRLAIRDWLARLRAGRS